MFRNEKIRFGQKVLDSVKPYSSAVVCKCEGLTAREMNALRLAINRAGGKAQMGGNLIIGKALEKSNFADLGSQLRGTSLTVFFNHSDSLLPVARALAANLKAHKERMAFKYCRVGDTVCSAPLFNLISRFQSDEQPMQMLLWSLTAPIQSLAILLKQYYELMIKEGQKL